MNFTVPSQLFSDSVVMLVFGTIAILLLCGAVRFWDWMTKGINEEKELSNCNMAVATVMAVYIASVAYIIGQVVGSVMGK